MPFLLNKKKNIFSSFGLEQNKNKNIFFIITDGSYLILKFTFDVISQIDKKKTEKKIDTIIDECINENKEIIKYLMQYKFDNLKNLIYRTYLALNYMDSNNFRYCIFFIGEKDNNRFENFYKEKLKKDESKLETQFSNKIKKLINNLIVIKEQIAKEIKVFKKNTKDYFYNLDLAGFISNQNQDLKLSDNFKININFFLTDKNIIICSDQDFIIKSELLTSTNFEKKFIECSRNKNIAKLSVFIDNTNVLKKYQGKKYNDYLLITKETQITKIFNNIKRYIQSRIPVFHQTLEEKINEKKMKLIKLYMI